MCWKKMEKKINKKKIKEKEAGEKRKRGEED